MPIYDYRCERTGEMFELWQAFSDDALTVCPQTHAGESAECGGAVKKVFSKVGISFKGGGFYKNDHGAGAKSRSSASSTSSNSSDSSSSSDSKTSGSGSSSGTSSSSPSKSGSGSGGSSSD